MQLQAPRRSGQGGDGLAGVQAAQTPHSPEPLLALLTCLQATAAALAAGADSMEAAQAGMAVRGGCGAVLWRCWRGQPGCHFGKLLPCPVLRPAQCARCALCAAPQAAAEVMAAYYRSLLTGLASEELDEQGQSKKRRGRPRKAAAS